MYKIFAKFKHSHNFKYIFDLGKADADAVMTHNSCLNSVGRGFDVYSLSDAELVAVSNNDVKFLRGEVPRRKETNDFIRNVKNHSRYALENYIREGEFHEI